MESRGRWAPNEVIGESRLKLKLVLFAGASVCAYAQYAGPSVLSRGGAMTDEQRGLPLGFQFYAGVTGIYDNGLLPVSVDQSGNLLKISSLYGVEANLGVSGARRTAKSALALSYSGNYRHYTSATYFDGSDHVLQLEGRKDFSRRFAIVSQTSAGTVSRTISALGGLVNTPDTFIGVPTNDVFDNRAYFVQTRDDLVIQKSARLSFSAGGDAFFVRRQSRALVGLNGYGAHGTMAYRLSRLSTVDVAYTYFHFDYPRAFGESNIHMVTGGFSRLLSPRWQFAIQGGVYRIDTIGITQVALDPVTAALFGQTTAVEAFQAISYRPAVTASITGVSGRRSVSFHYSRSPSPGNGVYLSSDQESGGATISYTGTSRLSLTANGTYNRLSSIGQRGLGRYTSTSGGGGVSYRLAQSLHASFRVDFRQFNIDLANGLSRLGTRVSVSLNYSPGERPLRIWR